MFVRAAIVTMCSAMVCACSSSPGNDPPPPSEAGTDGAIASHPGSGTTQSAGGGAILFSGGPSFAGSFFDVEGGFDVVTTSGGTYHCGATVGGCEYCPPLSAGDGAGIQLTSASAGVLTLTDGSATLATLAAEAGSYSVVSTSTPTLSWKPGDTLGVSVSGGQVPAFSVTLTAPQPLADVSPTLQPATFFPLAVSVSKAFVISWTPSADNGTVRLVLGTTSPNSGTIGCTVPESAGTVSIAPSVLANFSGKAPGTVGVTKIVSKTVNAGAFAITVTAQPSDLVSPVTYEP